MNVIWTIPYTDILYKTVALVTVTQMSRCYYGQQDINKCLTTMAIFCPVKKNL